MEESFLKPRIPAPQIPDSYAKLTSPHFSTPAGMQLPRNQQPPAMFGLRGSTIPAKHLGEYDFKRNQPYRPEIKRQNPVVYCDICDQAVSNLQRHRSSAHAEMLGIQPREYSAEEIAEWCEARKKRYPTLQNVINRQKAQEERKQRGERLEERNSRFGDRRDRRQMNQVPERSVRNRNRKRQKKKFEPLKEEKETSQLEVLDGLKKFRGTSKLEEYNEKAIVVTSSFALSCLGDYGDDESDEEVLETPAPDDQARESDDEPPEEVPIVKQTKEALTGSIDQDRELDNKAPDSATEEAFNCPKAQNQVDDEAPEEVPIGKQVPDVSSQGLKEEPTKSVEEAPESSRRRSRKRASSTPKPLKSRPQYPPKLRRYQNTLLEKLLEPDIRHERNVLLQCVRFVVQNNFFQETSSTETPKSP